MREDFLHYLWRVGQFDHRNLRTTQGETIDIVQAGHYNRHAGPDFTEALIRIGGELWAGNVEMHLRASEWQAHGHSHDPAYHNVILHVVLEEDEPVIMATGERLACLELRPHLAPGLVGRYQQLLHNQYWVPCQAQLAQVPDITRQLWLDRVLVERLERRVESLAMRLQHNIGDWEETAYQALARGFGAKVNAEPFELLARTLPLRLLWRHQQNRLLLEALLLGQAGLLPEQPTDPYSTLLVREFSFLRKKYQLTPLPRQSWKFMRMRPANFPTVRLAQLAALLHQSGPLFGRMLAAANLEELNNLFAVKLSNYWQDHYSFGKPTTRKQRSLGRETIHLLVINTIAPLLFFYGKHKGDDTYCTRALALLEATPSEVNHVTRGWKKLGITALSAYHSQALLELKAHYCEPRRCMHCAIGCAILGEMGQKKPPDSRIVTTGV